MDDVKAGMSESDGGTGGEEQSRESLGVMATPQKSPRLGKRDILGLAAAMAVLVVILT